MTAGTEKAVLLRAIEAHKVGRFAEAEAGYRRVLRRRPNDADALNFLGMMRVQTGEIGQGVELLRRSVKSQPRNPHAWTNLGNALMASGAFEEAHQAFSSATDLAPTMTEAWFNRGVCARHLKLPEEAMECFSKAVEFGPGYAAAYDALARLLYRARRLPEAIEVYRKWLAADPDNPQAKHMLAACTGENVPARAGDAYLTATFDAFADTFDENLQSLGYRAPELIAAAVTEQLHAPAGSRLDIVDAGCGTGWCGPLFKPLARTLVGVDISPGMVEKARARDVYDELIVAELSTFLRQRPGSADLIVSADTLVYFGELDEPLAAACACLRTGGMMAFTLERLEPGPDGQPYRIEPHGRYCHQESYVRARLAQAGFQSVSITGDTLRKEGGRDVAGHVVVAVK
ncbi:MAG TPA: tetratricopeptide repeat protein [Steroidobacter sp.]|uniref:tetratricopeptide repeat protein n=1 Tax=Steroidobacter sp. TaxID=1978227 RepID=UPI002EDB1527